MADHNELGKLGEEMARTHLEKKGYKILETNWYYQKAELDIIALKNAKTLVIVEVKTRSNAFLGTPEEFVSKSKIKMIIKATDAYLSEHSIDAEVQFDIIAIVKNPQYEKLEHIENAFYFFQ
jgi:putative endonuclease